MNSNNNYVCFKCMTHSRGNGNMLCPECKQEMVCIGTKIEVPKKNKKKWTQFQKELRKRN